MSEILLKEFKDGDMAVFKSWLYLPHVAKWYLHPESWINEVENRKGEFKWLNHFIAELNGRPIGFCQYYKYSDGGENWQGNLDIDGAYSIDYMIGEQTFLKKGYGNQMINLLVNKVLSHSDAKSMIVQPDSENKASCALLLSCGFLFDAANGIYVLNLR